MAIYNIYTCTVCRRSKSILRDLIYAIPNSCTITKGCTGHLLVTGESTLPFATPAVAGITDWYPRGTLVNTAVAEVSSSPVLLSTSSTGIVSLAVKMTDAIAATNATLTMNFSQRRVDDIPYTQYLFTLLIETQLLNGKDSSNKILRFNQAAIDEGRVIIRVNGVLQIVGVDYTLQPDKITFTGKIKTDGTIGYPIGSVDISVYTAQSTILRTLTFTANSSTAVTINAGSWGNVKWTSDNDGNKWHVYSCAGVSALPASARLQLTSLHGTVEFTDAVFLLASDPYDHVDRYLEFGIPIFMLKDSFNLSVVYGTVNQLFADKSAFTELFPPFILQHAPVLADSSFLSTDTFSSTVAADATTARFSGTKILGPI